MEEGSSPRLIWLAILATIGVLITIIVNWDKIFENAKRLKGWIFKSLESRNNEKMISALRDYIIHYGYDFNNGKGREWFMFADMAIDIPNTNVLEWISNNFDSAVNSLVRDGYLNKIEGGIGVGYELSLEGRNYYTSTIKSRIQKSVEQLEKGITTC